MVFLKLIKWCQLDKWASLVAQWYRICLQCRRPGFNPWVRKIPWRRAWQQIPNILAWKMPWTEEPGGLQSTRSQRVGCNWSNWRVAALDKHYDEFKVRLEYGLSILSPPRQHRILIHYSQFSNKLYYHLANLWNIFEKHFKFWMS